MLVKIECKGLVVVAEPMSPQVEHKGPNWLAAAAPFHLPKPAATRPAHKAAYRSAAGLAPYLPLLRQVDCTVDYKPAAVNTSAVENM